MNAVELSNFLGAPYRATLLLLQSGAIHGNKNKRKWIVSESEALKFKENKAKELEILRNELISLYWQGATVDSLQKRVREELKSKKIIAEKSSFAEKTIYESVMKSRVN